MQVNAGNSCIVMYFSLLLQLKISLFLKFCGHCTQRKVPVSFVASVLLSLFVYGSFASLCACQLALFLLCSRTPRTVKPVLVSLSHTFMAFLWLLISRNLPLCIFSHKQSLQIDEILFQSPHSPPAPSTRIASIHFQFPDSAEASSCGMEAATTMMGRIPGTSNQKHCLHIHTHRRTNKYGTN